MIEAAAPQSTEHAPAAPPALQMLDPALSTAAPRPFADAPLAVEMRGVTKRFPGVLANDRVDFSVRKGEIHALLGENGAGKSTLMNVLAGLYHANEGTIHVNGKPVRFSSPRDAIAAGVGMVHQHFMLVPVQTVAENIFLGLRNTPFRLNFKQMAAEVDAIGAQYGMRVDPGARIWQLSVGEQQRVEIIKMLYRGAQVLILDEPTAVLTPQETVGFFDTLRAMATAGKTIIFISHKLDEVLSIADRITVLRGGKVAATVQAQGMTKSALASLMVGRDVLFRLEKASVTQGEERLHLREVEALDNKNLPALRKLSLTVHEREIVGIAGVAGNGQRELAEVICGLRSISAGSIEVCGKVVAQNAPMSMIQAGIAYVPEDRSATGSSPNLSVSDNLAIKSYRWFPFSRGLFLRRNAMKESAGGLIKSFNIAAPSTTTPVRKLSGGNLQKVILAREISGSPKVLVAAYPTRGLDIGATESVRRILLDERAKGAAILLISEDLDEIFAISDRIAVIYEGRIVGDLPAADAGREEVGLLMAGHPAHEPASAPSDTTSHAAPHTSATGATA
jgi:simple sugar transport system ATP-binding protein